MSKTLSKVKRALCNYRDKQNPKLSEVRTEIKTHTP